jgi:hypothetical protein
MCQRCSFAPLAYSSAVAPPEPLCFFLPFFQPLRLTPQRAECPNRTPPLSRLVPPPQQNADFILEYAKSGRAKCKKCKSPVNKDELRIGK